MKNVRIILNVLQKTYYSIGIFAVALIAGCVMFSVIARYFFGVSFLFLEEFVTTVFAFTTLWGMGICIIEDEMVVISSLYNKLPQKIKFIVTYINAMISLAVLVVMIKYGFAYVRKFGHQISMGMGIPMKYMYEIIPLGCLIALICLIIKIYHYSLSFMGKNAGVK